MTFKVIITHNSEEGDEHIYYGSVYAARNFSQVKKLAFNSSLHRLEATFSFDDGQVPEGDNFLAVPVPVKSTGDYKRDNSAVENRNKHQRKMHRRKFIFRDDN